MNGYQIADLIIGLAISLLGEAFVVYFFKKKILWIVFGIEFIGVGICFSLGLSFAGFVFLACLIVTAVVSCFANLGDIRYYIANPLTSGSASKGKAKDNKEIDKAKLNKSITQAVKWLSDNKTGALITFERTSSLDKYIESGTILNAPVTSELIETIFYEGTRLHDGAVVIKGDIIVAAACFFPATTRTLVGKYGARHRAALGISEVTDSITIVVSEETGRISIAYNGTLEPIKYDEFEKVFATFMLAPSGTTTQKVINKEDYQ